MPSGGALNKEMDSQTQSSLFGLPVEIRRHTYALIVDEGVHVYLRDGHICISTCVTPQPSNDYFCFDRQSSGDAPSDVWARRLGSSWASHWRCEEVALGLDVDRINLTTGRDSTRALMQSCKRIYTEMADLVAEVSVLHVTELSTLDQLLQRDHDNTWLFTDSMFLSSFAGVRSLHLAFRLPLQVYKMIELQDKQSNVSTHPPNQLLPTMWKGIWPAIAGLKHLRSLDVYLDHDSEASWTLVDEATILRHLLPLSKRPHISTTVRIPKLPPRQDTDQDAGSSMEKSPSLLDIQRFIRQRFFPQQRQDGTHGIVYEHDANNMFGDPDPSADELTRTAELTMHLWLHGIELDYLAMSRRLGW
ncbi:uncharacterized protein MAM_06355 [Metarhizium album ARSEF 1941]|uniref:DUF7730 domain-containing protein n=1 Tax=Metarhizium album (strain ARSEF 1941) TaxID=1081103 RepID=A0A0B2WP23_METAS|nr:uncharacterized protein MAM_06355 [Metarhizium album ARSEF 1941]KHN95743.1 hypothetical protein MAM_06355 [Metarhizium album ARSEF 1941]